MAYFIKLQVVGGPVSRVNADAILRYYPSEHGPATMMELVGGGLLVVADSVETIDELLEDSE